MRNRFRRARALLLVVSVAMPLIGLSSEPASAAVTTTGNMTFHGTAFLPTFPCPPPPPFGTGPCTGNFTGHWAGHLAGVSGTNAFDVTWATTPTPVLTPTSSAMILVNSFQYAEWQCAAETETILGIAQGTGSADVVAGQLQGKWQQSNEAFARDITGITFTFSFKWTRIGNTAVLVLPTATLNLIVSGLPAQTVINNTQQVGAATFALTGSSNTVVPSCATPLTNVNGIIAGDLPLAGAL